MLFLRKSHVPRVTPNDTKASLCVKVPLIYNLWSPKLCGLPVGGNRHLHVMPLNWYYKFSKAKYHILL